MIVNHRAVFYRWVQKRYARHCLTWNSPASLPLKKSTFNAPFQLNEGV